MNNMIKFEPKQMPAFIKVLGVGGGGSNAVNHMFKQGIKGVDFVICNTDVQALDQSPVPLKVVLGERVLGAGNKPIVGKEAAVMSIDKIKEMLKDNTQMLFITAGMGGGTGTGAAPIIAQAAQELGILTVGIVTLPFSFEGRRRMEQAKKGIEEFKDFVDTLLVICNDKLRELYGDAGLSEAFAHADDVLTSAAKGIAELITVPGYVNIDFEDVKTVIEKSGKAIMGSADAEGEGRAHKAIEAAMNSPLLNDNDIKGARNILLYIMTGEEEIRMDEITEITDYVQSECGGDFETDVIWGNGKDANLGNKLSITIIATGFNSKQKKKPDNKKVKPLYENDKKDENVKDTDKNVAYQHKNKVAGKKEAEEPFDFRKIKKSDAVDTAVKTEDTTDKKHFQTSHDGPEINQSPKEEDQEKVSLFGNSGKRLAIGHTVSSHDMHQAKEDLKHYVSKDNNEDELIEKSAVERSQKLRQMSMIRPENVEKYEKEPAYVRKNIDIEEPLPSSDTKMSKYVLGEDSKNNPLIKTDNSYLHDNVD